MRRFARLKRRRLLAGAAALLAGVAAIAASSAMMRVSAATAHLRGSDAFIEAHFARGGAYPDHEGRVTSEAQAYAMLRAVWSGDQGRFMRAWAWTSEHLLQPSGLAAWLWQHGAVIDGSSAADADTDMAMALLLAGRRWGDPTLSGAGAQMARAIWDHEVAEAAGRPYLMAGPWAAQPDRLVINPSYFAPYAYRLFAAADPDHPWESLLDAGYALIERLGHESLAGESPVGLPPDWAAIRRADGALLPADLGPRDSTLYSYDAPRLYWRVALDLAWADDPRARLYLEGAHFLRQAVAAGGPAASYTRAGAVEGSGTTMVGIAGAYAALRICDPPLAEQLYDERIATAARGTNDELWWGEPGDLYTQEWAWFIIALRVGRAPQSAGFAAAPK